MLDLVLLCGLHDCEALRLSSIGQDPDREIMPPKRRICLKNFGGDPHRMLAGINARTSEDRETWRIYQGLVQ